MYIIKMDCMKFGYILLCGYIIACDSFVLKNTTLWAGRVDIDALQVTTAQGIVEGVMASTVKGTAYASFKGIPFATPPVGDLRFKDPIPAESWTGVLETTKFKETCVQPNMSGPDKANEEEASSKGSEDCLYLNVYTTALDDGPKPVLVHVHGGAFEIGDSRSNFDNLIDEDIVIVTITYRLGVFGFLSLGTGEVPGNAGMKDQVMALKWVRENIGYFGGDPNDVTIYGESAGGHSVSHLHISPMAKGLVNRVIASSGTALNGCSIQKNPQRKYEKLAEILALDSTDVNDFLEELRSLSAYEINVAAQAVAFEPGSYEEELNFSPVVEETFDGVESFYYKSPIDYITDVEFNDIPVLIGYDSKEYAGFASVSTMKTYIEDDITIVPDNWRLTATDSEIQQLAQIIRDTYLGTQTLDTEDKEKVLGAVDLLGDLKFIQPIIETADVLAQYSTNPVYLYRFSYRGGGSAGMIEELGAQGASHVADGEYLKNTGYEQYSSNGWVSRRMIKIFVNFIKTGNPTPGPADSLLPIIWERATADTLNYVNIDGDIIPSKNPDHIRRTFWVELESAWRLKQLDSWNTEAGWSK